MGDGRLEFEDAKIIYRNFAGAEGRYNQPGDRNFCVLIDPETAAVLRTDGWNVRQLKPREEGDTPQDILQVSVSYKGRTPPYVVLINSKGRLVLDEEMIDVLDQLDIDTVDMVINPYRWSIRGSEGIAAYVKTMYVKIHEHKFDLKYADLDLLPTRSGRVDD